MKKIVIIYIMTLFGAYNVINANDLSFKSILSPHYGNWILNDSVQFFESENLYDYIDGAADNYLSMGFQKLEVATYNKLSDKYITVELYKHQSDILAFGIYAQERPNKANFDRIGGQAYKEGSILNFFAGNYYIKFSSHDKSTETQAIILQLATDIAAKINSNRFPEIFSKFPEARKIQNSEFVVNSNFLGYEFMKCASLCKYSVGDQNFKIFIIETNSNTETAEMVKQLCQKTQTFFDGHEGDISIQDTANGKILASWKDKFMWGVLIGTSNISAEEYLRQIEKKLF